MYRMAPNVARNATIPPNTDYNPEIVWNTTENTSKSERPKNTLQVVNKEGKPIGCSGHCVSEVRTNVCGLGGIECLDNAFVLGVGRLRRQ